MNSPWRNISSTFNTEQSFSWLWLCYAHTSYYYYYYYQPNLSVVCAERCLLLFSLRRKIACWKRGARLVFIYLHTSVVIVIQKEHEFVKQYDWLHFVLCFVFIFLKRLPIDESLESNFVPLLFNAFSDITQKWFIYNFKLTLFDVNACNLKCLVWNKDDVAEKVLCGGGVFLGGSGWGMEREMKTTKLCIQHSKVFILNIPYTTLQKILSYSNTTLHPPHTQNWTSMLFTHKLSSAQFPSTP